MLQPDWTSTVRYDTIPRRKSKKTIFSGPPTRTTLLIGLLSALQLVV